MIIKWSNLSSKMEPVAHLKHLSENYTKIIQTTLLRLHTDCTEIAKCYQTAIKVNVVDVPVSAVFAFVDNIPKTHTG